MAYKKKVHPFGLLKIALSREILHTDPRNRDMTELFKQMQTKGAYQAWTDYVIEDLNELIIDCGAKYVMQNLNAKAKQLLIDYIKDKKPSRNDGQQYEYELNKSTGEVEKKFNDT
jgi:hypothetical protein